MAKPCPVNGFCATCSDVPAPKSTPPRLPHDTRRFRRTPPERRTRSGPRLLRGLLLCDALLLLLLHHLPARFIETLQHLLWSPLSVRALVRAIGCRWRFDGRSLRARARAHARRRCGFTARAGLRRWFHYGGRLHLCLLLEVRHIQLLSLLLLQHFLVRLDHRLLQRGARLDRRAL